MRISLRIVREHRMLFGFIALALVVRIVFWLYTGRVWEDAMITLTPARNAWEGVGLTHHASEPRVHSFTSPISVLVPLVGEAFRAGLITLRLASLVAAVGTIYFAYRIGLLLRFGWAAHVLLLTYLSCDQLQIFFGMSGMETQIATAIALAILYFYMTEKWGAFGLACGLAAITRPEFVLFLLPPFGLAVLVFHTRHALRAALAALMVAGPWYLFAQLYYGSIIPHTIVAKSLSFRTKAFSAPLKGVWEYTRGSWADFVPFKEFCFSQPFSAPLPDPILKIVLAALVGLILTGLFFAARRQKVLLVVGAAVIGFLVYRNSTVQNSYYMWYLPPFMALGFVVAGYGLSAITSRIPMAGGILGPVLAFSYALHMPFSFPLERKVQRLVEVDVRARVGRILNGMMTKDDTAVLEPLGYIGWEARNKTIFDFPGLGSRVSVAALKDASPPTGAVLINVLNPTYAVVRPREFHELVRHFPATAAKYEVAARIRAKQGLRFRRMGYQYSNGDTDYSILRRTTAFEEVVRP
ncbi:MAG TPA: hypothetical protein VJS88_01690 [Chthoniobacterales bacterium]|nr:hypothetical protein [Chthoniobacterales bacterium]